MKPALIAIMSLILSPIILGVCSAEGPAKVEEPCIPPAPGWSNLKQDECQIQRQGQAPPSPAVRGFGDSKFWITVEKMRYTIGGTDEVIVVPQGFVTDFASIPQALWSLGLSPYGQYSRAAVIHDFLYWSQGCTRSQADRLLVIAMKESNVGWFDEFVVYQGVEKGGRAAWETNAAERVARLPRVIPEAYERPADPNEAWQSYRQFLIGKGVTDPNFDANPPYCRFGNSTTVP